MSSESLLARIGPLRIVLWLVAFVIIIPVFDQGVYGTGYYILANYVAPAMVVLVAWGILLDILMSAVMRAGRPEQRTRYGWLAIANLVVFSILTWAWWPYFSELLL